MTVRGPDGEVAVLLTPVRALELAKEMIQPEPALQDTAEHALALARPRVRSWG